MTPDSITRRRAKAAAAILVSVLALGGCGPRQLFAAGQAWRGSICAGYPEPQHSRCRAEASRSYDEDRQAASRRNFP